MKKTIIAIALVLVGCKSANDAMQATKDMGGKMDDTNIQIKRTNDRTDEMAIKMEKTIVGMHRQTLQVAFENLVKKENAAYTEPFPYDMAPFAEVFAQEVNPSELVQLFYIQLKRIDEQVPPTKLDGTAMSDAEMDREKQARLIALEALAGLTPPATFRQIVATEIKGFYPRSVYGFIMLRELFLKEKLLDSSALSGDFLYVGEARRAVVFASMLDEIAMLDAKILSRVSVQTIGFRNPELNLNTKHDVSRVTDTWSKLNRRINSEVFINQVPSVSDAAEVKELEQLKSLVSAKDSYWKTLQK